MTAEPPVTPRPSDIYPAPPAAPAPVSAPPRWPRAVAIALLAIGSVAAGLVWSPGLAFVLGLLAGGAALYLAVAARLHAPPAAAATAPAPPGTVEPDEGVRHAQKLEAVGRLAGGVAHDFNNLLTVITGYAGMLVEALPAGSPDREMAREIHKAGERAAGLTRQLLAFSRKQVLQPRLVDLNGLITEVGGMLGRLVREDVELTTRLQPGPLPVLVDPGQVEQVLMNLAANARDAMPKGGRLTITTGCTGGPAADRRAVLSVADTGEGMDAATKARIFEPFFTTKVQGKGVGLGLATVYGIIRQSGGAIEVDSAPGAGTTFRITLPLAPGAPTADTAAAGPTSQGSETILIAEDEDGVRALARRTLERQGYRVIEARNGVEAVVRCRQHAGTIDLLLTDMIMPQMGGDDLARSVRRQRPAIKVVFMTGYTDSALLPQDGAESESGWLGKPFTADVLARMVRNTLDGCPCEPVF